METEDKAETKAESAAGDTQIFSDISHQPFSRASKADPLAVKLRLKIQIHSYMYIYMYRCIYI